MIKLAYQVLSSEKGRKCYDKEGREGILKKFSFGFMEEAQRKRTSNASYEVAVTLMELFNGNKKIFACPRTAICPQCKGFVQVILYKFISPDQEFVKVL